MPLKKQQATRAGHIWVFYLGSLGLLFLAKILSFFNTTTQLYPSHDRIAQACLVFGCITGLAAGGWAIYLTTKLAVIQRFMLPLVLAFVSAIGVFLTASSLASTIEGWLDFPVGTTRRAQVLLFISRAYQTHGKGAGHYIQTMPVWSNLKIGPEDYAFMRSHRTPADPGKNPDEITSRGYFCAKVAIEVSNTAVRILQAGSHELPRGTVEVCPPRAERQKPSTHP